MNRLHALCLVLLSAWPLAHAAPTPPAETAAPGVRTAPAAVLSGRYRQASPATLEQQRGGNDAVTSDMRLQGTTNGNSAANIATGNNLIQSGSFANAAGVPVVIQNSGANVLIQNATVVNVLFK